MAYWYIRFKSRDGNTYEARITGKTGNTNVQLQGAESPFTTEEKDTDSMFEPVITQSGYLQIEDDGYDLSGNTFDWHNLVPTNSKARPVKLYQISNGSTTLRWAGYIQPRTFDGDYMVVGQTRKFPLVCLLSTLESEDVDPEAYETANIARIIYYLTGDFANEYAFQGFSSVISEWLPIRVNWSLFADVQFNDEAAYGVIYETKINKLQLLEDVCKFFGWTCRIQAHTLFFSSPDSGIAEGGWQTISAANLLSIANGTQVTPTDTSWQNYAMSNNPFATDDNTEYYLPGIKKAVITADKGEEIKVPKFDDSAMKNWIEKYQGYPNMTTYSKMYYFYLYATGVMPTNDVIYDFKSMTDPEDNTKILSVYYSQYEYFQGDYSALQHKHNYSWSTRLVVQYNNISGASYPLFTMKSRFPVSLNLRNGREMIVLNATTYQSFVNTHDGQSQEVRWRGAGTLWCKLRIGDYYYDGYDYVRFSSGGGYWPAFPVAVGTEDNNYQQTGQIICNRTLDDVYMPYDGLGLINGAALDGIGGIMEFQICGYDCSESYVNSHYLPPILQNLAHSLFIENLKIEIVTQRQYYLPIINKELKYTADSGADFNNTTEESMPFASYSQGQSGTGIIMDENLAYVEKLKYEEQSGYNDEHPEQQLADRRAYFGNKSRKVLSLELESKDIPDISPVYKIEDFNGTDYYPLVLKCDWKEGQTTIKMIEL